MGSHSHASASHRGFRFEARLAAAMLMAATIGFAWTAPSKAEGSVEWNAKASKELEEALHDLHRVWDSGDIPAIRRLLMGDELLTSFELDPTDHTPIRLKSRQDIDAFIDKVVSTVEKGGLTATFDHPKVNCRATAGFGICTEECTIHFTRPNGPVRTDKLWSTAVAIKVSGEWRWIQWQMAEAAKEKQSEK
jgi:hypothetical protein